MKYIKTIFTLLLSLCLLLTGTAFAQEYPCNGTIIKNAVNVRKSASAKSDKVGSLKNGDIVSVMGEETVGNTIWYQIEMKNGKPGYVRGDLIEVGAATIPSNASSDVASTDDSFTAQSTNNANASAFVSLKSGNSGEDVIKLQNRLAELAYFFEASNGKYGDSTVKAVKEFQKDANLKVTGTADEQTQQLLYSDEAWGIRADALDKKTINVGTYEKKANAVVKNWDKKKVGSYTASADIHTTKSTKTYSVLTMALPVGISLFDQYGIQLSIWDFDNIKKASPTLSINISTQYMYGTSGASVYIQTKNYNQRIDSAYLSDVNTTFKSKQIELQAYPDVAADLAKNGGTVKIGSNSYTISTSSQFYKAYKDVYQIWKDMELDTIMAYTQFYERYQKVQKEWAAATPVPTDTPQPTNPPAPTDVPQQDAINATSELYELGFTFAAFRDRFINSTTGVALAKEIVQNGDSGTYWTYGLSPDGGSDFAFGDVNFRSSNQTSEEGYSIWLNICYEDSPDHFEEWASSIHNPDDLHTTNQYSGFKDMACLFIQTLAPNTSNEDAYQVLSNAIQKSATEGYQYYALLDGFSLGEGTGFPRAGDFEFNFAYGGNWLELDARRYQNGQSTSETLDINSISMSTAVPVDTTLPDSSMDTLPPSPVPTVTPDASISKDFLYASNGTEVRINAYIGDGGDVIIPDEIDGLPVTQLADESFSDRAKTLTRITLPKNLATIGYHAFKKGAFSEITLPQGLTTISSAAFYESDVSGTLVIPESVEVIGDYAFDYTNLSGLIIQSSCEIGQNAFKNCKNMNFVYIKDGCDISLSKEIFAENKALNIVVIPASVTSISNSSFKGCNYVKIITPSGSYAEQYAKENFIMYETDTYDEYVAQYEALCIQDITVNSSISIPVPDNSITEVSLSPVSPTLGETNALSSARSYLSYNSFSHDGLIDQLEYEGYTTTEATYAADNCGANWNDQALKSALDYFDFTSFSYAGIINQLVYEQFTTEQATYAADNCGANWNDQAVKCAANYLSFSSFSRSGLIEQLEYEGFTHEQAVYGVEQNGY